MVDIEPLLRDLVVANRILAHENVVDAYGHVSVRNPNNPDRYFLSCSRSPELVQRSDIMEFELGDSTMTYRTRYLSTVQLPVVLDLLISDDTNPRSIAFQAETLKQHIAVLPRDTEQAILPREKYLVESIVSELRLLDIYALSAQRSRRGTRTDLDNLLKKLQAECSELSDILARSYFSHAMTVRSGISGVGSFP